MLQVYETLSNCLKCEDISFKFCSPREVPSQLIGGVGKSVAGGGLLNFAPAYGKVPSSSESDEDQLALD